MNRDATINFNGADINLSDEYHEARKMMGLKTTDLVQLYHTVSHVYICIPEHHPDWACAYLSLMEEIQMRERMLFNMKLDKLIA